MESIDFFILDDLHSNKYSESFIIMTDSMYNNLLNSINFNYLLIIFTIGCFSTLICCNKNNNRYKLISTSEPIEGKIVV